MKKLQFAYPLLLAALIFVACRREEANGPAAATVTPEAATVTPAAARGSESPPEAVTPGASPTPISNETDLDGNEEGFVALFQTRPDGFGFRNYSVGFPEGDFTIDELRALFGDGVCSRIERDKCIPTAVAQQWISDRNADMDYGHCIGFTVASYRFLQEDLQPAAFTANAAAPYDIAQEAPIMRTIAANGSLYWVDSVWKSEVSGTPREIIDALVALGEPVDLSIFQPGLAGGHSLFAYGVQKVAPETYHILVYDNNFPGEDAYVEVDYEANTWRYAKGTANPGAPALVYEGDAGTQTLRFIPLSAYETVSCPFCSAEEEENDQGFTLLSFFGRGNVLVETEQGAVGFVDGEMINQLPGAEFIHQRGQLSAAGTPGIFLPPGVGDYTMHFNGMERVSSLNSDFSLVLDQLTPASDDSLLEVVLDNKGVTYRAGGAQSPTLKAIVNQQDAVYRLALLGADLANGQALSLGVAENGAGLEISSQGSDLTDATLLVTRLTDTSEAIFATSALEVMDGSSVALDITTWDGSSGILLFVDVDGDGVYDELPIELANEPLAEILRQSTVGETAVMLADLSPYLNDGDLAPILAALPDLEAPAQALGQILQPLQLSNEQLIAALPPLSLPAAELAELLFGLRLGSPRQDAVIRELDLGEDDETALRARLEDLSRFHDISSEWAFLNRDDPSELAALLAVYDLAPAQLAQLLPQLGLNAGESDTVLSGLNLSPDDLTSFVEPPNTGLPAVSEDELPLEDISAGEVQEEAGAGLGSQSIAFCDGNNLRITAFEPTWINTTIEIRSDEGVLASITLGVVNEPIFQTIEGPGSWTNLRLEASTEPLEVPLGTISCP